MHGDEQQSLAALRRQIDEIDGEIHALLMRRTEVALRIGTLKGADAVHMRPGREAMVLRRRIAEHRGALPKSLIVRLWREIFSAVTALQGPLAIAVYAPEGSFGYRNLARDHYGWRTPISAYRSAAQVLEAVSDGRATVGVLPLPYGDLPEPWWRNLARSGASVPRIIARLPFAMVEPPRGDSPEGLAIGLAPVEPTGLDHSFVVIETGQVVSRSHLKELVSGAGFTVLDMQASEEPAGRWLHLIEVDGFVAAGDARQGQLLRLGEGRIESMWPIGGFAVPLSQAEMDGAGGTGEAR